MAEQKSDGKHTSKIPPSSEEQRKIKQAAKARRRHSTTSRFTQNNDILPTQPGRPQVFETHEERAMRELKSASATKKPTAGSDLPDGLLANFINDFGAIVATRSSRWSPEEKVLAHSYVKSLVMGDGTRPDGLSDNVAGSINNAFMGTCFRMIVGTDTLPGQRQEWYQTMVSQTTVKKPAPELVNA